MNSPTSVMVGRVNLRGIHSPPIPVGKFRVVFQQMTDLFRCHLVGSDQVEQERCVGGRGGEHGNVP